MGGICICQSVDFLAVLSLLPAIALCLFLACFCFLRRESRFIRSLYCVCICMNACVCAIVVLFTVDKFYWIFGVNGMSWVLTPASYICNLQWAVKWWTQTDTGNVQPWVQTWCDVPDLLKNMLVLLRKVFGRLYNNIAAVQIFSLCFSLMVTYESLGPGIWSVVQRKIINILSRCMIYWE